MRTRWFSWVAAVAAALGLVPAAAAQVTVTDWRGESAALEEGAALNVDILAVYMSKCPYT